MISEEKKELCSRLFILTVGKLVLEENTVTASELIGKVHSAVYHQCQQRGYAAPVDVLMDVGVLSKQKYEEWRYGKVTYLEQVCTRNLRKLSFIMSQIRKYAEKSNLKPSFCYYKQWETKVRSANVPKSGKGRKPVILLRFSKSGKEDIERAYATHFVDVKRTEQIKKEKEDKLKREGE